MATLTEKAAANAGCYVYATTYDGGVFAGSTITGWTVRFRRGNARPGQHLPVQHQTFRNPSLFGVLRQIVREGQRWNGRVFHLEILSVAPVRLNHYEYPDNG